MVQKACIKKYQPNNHRTQGKRQWTINLAHSNDNTNKVLKFGGQPVSLIYKMGQKKKAKMLKKNFLRKKNNLKIPK